MALTAKPYLREISIRDDADIDTAHYPFSIPAVRDMNTLSFHPDVTFFIGENGAGKSTMLEAIAVAMGLPAEGGSGNVARRQQQVAPRPAKSYDVPAVAEPPAGGPVGDRPAGQTGSQFIIATHAPILLAYPNAKILVFDQAGLSEVAYEDTEHYAITRDFLTHYERRLQQLLGDGQDNE
jgi:predicted ATPase